jgi:NhaP-type Na+/H+ or K+/H+ antiporter
MTAILWFLIVGGLLVVMALAGTVLERLPLTAAMLYVVVGYAIGPAGLALIDLDPVDSSALLERLTEIAVVISLFSAGLKLREPWRSGRWGPPLRLAFVSMTLTVAMVAAAGVLGLGLPLGAAVLLGAVLAPTDPVLASDVQVDEPTDRDRLRFALTGEAGLNDGTAFPFVMLGLGLLGLHELGPFGIRWVAIDVLWGVAGGLAIGALLGTLVGRLVLHLRREYKSSVGYDDFLTLGLIALSYGIALLAHSYGFLAVFAAGLAVRRIELQSAGATSGGSMADVKVGDHEAATAVETAPAYMAHAALVFNQPLERVAEVTVVVLIGSMLSPRYLPAEALWFVPLLLLVIRPAAVAVGLAGSRVSGLQKRLASWFGIRGVGSLYYLMYAIERGLPGNLAARLTGLVLTTIAVSVVAHGFSVTPLMARYRRQIARRDAEPASGA